MLRITCKYLTNLALLDGVEIAPSTVTPLLGVLIDERLSFEGHICHLTRNRYYQLRRIKAIHPYIPTCIAIQLGTHFSCLG